EGDISNEELIEKVSKGEIDYTISDEPTAQISMTYYSNLDSSVVVSFPQKISWIVRRNSPELLREINKWIIKVRSDGTLDKIKTKYYLSSRYLNSDNQVISYLKQPENKNNSAGRISPYDKIFQIEAERLGWDWRLLAALCYTESKFNPEAKSWAGAVGLMQLMPSTAMSLGMSRDEFFIPEKNIKVGVRHLIWLDKYWERIKNKDERTKFVIASYNAGQGHILDARIITQYQGKNPDILAMTATPIPRTLCLTLYGDLKLITIKNKPKGRKPIVTKWITEDKRQNVYTSIKKYVSQGRQAFIVYPIIEESEKIDLESCIESYEKLKRDVFREFEVGLLHGKMKTAEKESVMDSFKRNKIQILVTTTVVEVGIDVPNATVLVIENSDRFGISQLHQLRGRVGRSDLESFCILMTSLNYSEDAKVRLEAMVASGDGFYLSEVDLKLRGPGELLGIRQSGLPDFKVANLQDDITLIEEARADIADITSLGELEKTEIAKRFEEGKILFSN
ncbi:MAG: hypothetical protein EBS19_01680, partial [Spirochaetia bacterium]|nr:hypothetical protein [Spirochaetia bacterium]